jgi:tetratricopeptide (TPR) repeat protein
MADTFVDYNGKQYVWTGEDWYEAGSYLLPPVSIISYLNRKLAEVLADTDRQITERGALFNSAIAAREAGQYQRAERLIRRALSQSPQDQSLLAVLSSILRARGLPQQAIDETGCEGSINNPALLTSRAAAFCDLRLWERAKAEVGRALAIEGSEEAFNVVHRIKAERPELYR